MLRRSQNVHKEIYSNAQIHTHICQYSSCVQNFIIVSFIFARSVRLINVEMIYQALNSLSSDNLLLFSDELYEMI